MNGFVGREVCRGGGAAACISISVGGMACGPRPLAGAGQDTCGKVTNHAITGVVQLTQRPITAAVPTRSLRVRGGPGTRSPSGVGPRACRRRGHTSRTSNLTMRAGSPGGTGLFFSGVSQLAAVVCCACYSGLAARQALIEVLRVATPGPPSSVVRTRGTESLRQGTLRPSLQPRPAAPAGRVLSFPGAGAPGPPASASLRPCALRP